MNIGGDRSFKENLGGKNVINSSSFLFKKRSEKNGGEKREGKNVCGRNGSNSKKKMFDACKDSAFERSRRVGM